MIIYNIDINYNFVQLYLICKENGILNKWLIQTLHGFKYLISTSQIRKLEEYINNSISINISTLIFSLITP